VGIQSSNNAKEFAMEALIHPDHLHSRSEVLSNPSPVPATGGIYAWYFREIPGVTPTEGCAVSQGRTLLYVGISPDKAGKPNSTQNLRTRVRYHFKGNAEGSTLRKTLGVLLSHESGYPLRRVGSGKRMTFTHEGENWIDSWMERNAFVCWAEHPSPWQAETGLIRSISLPLNIRDNESHFFTARLKSLRKESIQRARELHIADERTTTRSDTGKS
jgi:hypothetical protein